MYQFKKVENNLLEVTLSDRVTRGECELMLPELDDEIKRQGEVRVLFDISDMQDIEASAAWEELKFDFRHRDDVEKVAVLGNQKWQEWAAQFFGALSDGEIEYFEETQRHRALDWARA